MNSQIRCKPQIGVLDTDFGVLAYIHRILSDRFNVSLFTEAEELSQKLKGSAKLDLLLMGWPIDAEDTGQDTLKFLAQIRALKPSLPIVLLACSADLKDVVLATRMGATDAILKPFRKADIDLVVQRCLEDSGKLGGEEDDQVREIPLDDNTSLVLSSKRMREIESQCRLVAQVDIPVLILGESGTGKEVATIFIHKLSARSHRSFLKVNCAAMPADLLESELFGYEQGAFTGAVKSKPGKFEQCNGGTIFLDEIGEMPAALQAKLLQVLQDGSFSRLGGRASVKVDVRVIAATNIDIKAAIAQKTFREDLYYRLNAFTLKMPPLRERMEEIPILAHHFMRKVAAKYERDPLPISPLLMKALMSQTWPGNLRELENTIKRYLILGSEQAIIEDLNPLQNAGGFEPAGDGAGASPGLKHLVRNLKGGAESAAIEQALRDARWNRKVAASELQISYKALLYKIKQYNLNPPRQRPAPIVRAPDYDLAETA
jgi:two-component system, NtrC family, response regulator AtoC